MEPNNIENQIREKLNSREIQPSAKAWDRLDAMLTVGEEKKTKRSFFSFKYIGIADSVLVFVTLGLFFFNQKNTTIEPQNTVVETKILINPSLKFCIILSFSEDFTFPCKMQEVSGYILSIESNLEVTSE